MGFSYYGVSDTKEVEGFAATVGEARTKIREGLKGEKINWGDNVTIVKTED